MAERHKRCKRRKMNCGMSDDMHQSTCKSTEFSRKPATSSQDVITEDPHEIAAKEKSKTFIGRDELVQQIFNHCASTFVENSTMVVEGRPGNGKSALIAEVAVRYMWYAQFSGDFLFVHIVDSCPGLNNLENMLRRLHEKLCAYTGKENPLKTILNLKSSHVAQVEDTARERPHRHFVILVDAVNQLKDNMHAHTLWWLPSKNSPGNLRVVISTLSGEGGKLKESLARFPSAIRVEVGMMPAAFPQDVTTEDPHEIAAKEKSKTFIGRDELVQRIFNHCHSAFVKNSVMVVEGRPGNGKSALMSEVAVRCMEFLRPTGDFVFIHIVDSCPKSNILENMLRGLHLKLSAHTGTDNTLNTTLDLKSLHVEEVEETARAHPDLRFVILVDAVNQFKDSMHARTLWWLPSKESPKNLRVVISMLSGEGGKLKKSLERFPSAVRVEVGEMSKDDCEEMVSAALQRNNLDITTDNSDAIVGNQMEELLRKSHSPLYLSTAVEGLRSQWIREKESTQRSADTTYIRNLPPSIPELFEFLLFSWEGDLGRNLISWFMTIIALSRDGVTKDMLEDLLKYVKDTGHNISLNHSLNTVLHSVRGILSSGGGEYIRFFHNQLTGLVLDKYDRRNFIAEVHGTLVQFFLLHINSQLSEKPVAKPPYYEDSLSQVVHQQTALRRIPTKSNNTLLLLHTYKETLQNIFFISERIVLNQESELLSDYRETSSVHMEEVERAALSEWERFASYYWPYIKQFPQWSYSFAMNQPNNSAVAMETGASLRPDVGGTFPLMWLNKPDEFVENGTTIRCVGELCWSCCVSTEGKNLCAFGCDHKAFICDLRTGDIVHQIKVCGGAMSVHFSPNCDTLWVGNNYGKVTVWNVETGGQEYKELQVGEGWVLMIQHVDESTVVCGLGGDKTMLPPDTVGTITLINTNTHSIIRTWSTEIECVSYCYHAGEGVVVSGHWGKIICWDVRDGSEVKRFEEYVYLIRDMCAHKELPLIVFAVGTRYAGEVKTLDITTGECKTVVPEAGRYVAQFDHTGDKIICTDVNGTTIKIYDMGGVPLNTIRIHAGQVKNITSLPHTYSFISAASDGGKLHIPSLMPVEENTTKVVTWCDLLPNRKEFVTLNEDGEVSVWDLSTLQLFGNVMVKFGMAGFRAAVHPTGEFMVVCTWRVICVVDLYNVNMVYICRTPSFKEGDTIMCAQFSPSGDMCVILTAHHGTHVYKVHNMCMFEHHLTFMEMDGMWVCDVVDRKCVNGGDEGIVLWDIDTGKTLLVLRTKQGCRYIKFLNHPQRILYHIWDERPDEKRDQICVMDMVGHDLLVFNTKVDNYDPKLHIVDKYMITAECDGSLRLHNLENGEIMFVFVDEKSLGFNGFVDNPEKKTITCYNGNGSNYIFEKTFVLQEISCSS